MRRPRNYYRRSYSELVVLALALRPHTMAELQELLRGDLDPSNPAHSLLIHDRPVHAIKGARSKGYRIYLCDRTDCYYLSIGRPS